MSKMEPNRFKKCRCKREVDYKEADELVKFGEALWVVVARERGKQEKQCRMCASLPTPDKTCAMCKGTGKMEEAVEWNTYNKDIVLVNHRTKSNKISTPRVPTIESEHIERAYVEGNEEAAARIEEYGYLIQMVYVDLGARLRGLQILNEATGKKEDVFPGHPEPVNETRGYPPGSIEFRDGSKNKSWWWKIEGRDNDYGRAV